MKIASLILAAGLVAAPAFAETCGSKAKAASYHKAETVQAYHAGYDGDEVERVDIVDTAVAAGSFNTLVAAAQAAGLVDALKGDGPLTVFAPTDEAFAALPAGTVETLLKPENKDALAGVLKLHVIAGKVKSKDLAGKTISADTLNGEIHVDGTDGVVITAPGSTATVVTADVMASNGIIHVIDTVLLPGS